MSTTVMIRAPRVTGPSRDSGASCHRQAVAREVGAAKTRLAKAVIWDVMRILNYAAESASVAIEDVQARDWAVLATR